MSPYESFELYGFELKVYHVTEMTQWQLDCDQDISSVNTQMQAQKSTVFAGHVCFFSVSVLQPFATLMK